MRRTSPTFLAATRLRRGFSLIELMVAMGLGFILIYGIVSVYLTTKAAYRRVEQVSSLQQSVRLAFEYLTADARTAGMLGCAPRAAVTSPLSTSSVGTNYLLGVEGYNAAAAPSYPLDDATSAGSSWSNNTAPSSSAAIPFSDLGGIVTQGSDVVVLRTVTTKPLKLATAASANAPSLRVEAVSGGTCADASSRASGFCAGSHGLIVNCQRGRVFTVATAASGATDSTLTLSGALGASGDFPEVGTEVFPLQTVVYYVKTSSNGSSHSLFRRVFDGNLNGVDQELVEGVETMQVTYGVDTPPIDGAVDSYVTADAVTDWAQVHTIRMSLLLRAAEPLDADMSVPASGVVNGVSVTYPTTGRRFDRRVFTTTVAVRNTL
ncbi:PilW family protein [Sphaerotilaceae bacterium SBD11-9]